MAEEQVASFSDAPISDAQKAKEFEEHTGTYAAFMQATKWSIGVTVAILIILYFVFIH